MSADYPPAIWIPAASGNYRLGSSRTISTIVIHITDGGATQATQTAAWFANPNQHNRKGKRIRVSAHYIVGRGGDVVQCVRHADIAHHAGNANSSSIGIEHVVPRGSRPTVTQYEASAALVDWLCRILSIPMERTSIRGHAEVDRTTTHTSCPNKAWDWGYYWMCLVCAGVPSFETVIADSLRLNPAGALH